MSESSIRKQSEENEQNRIYREYVENLSKNTDINQKTFDRYLTTYYQIVLFANALTTNITLTRIIISRNNIGYIGLENLAEALKVNETIIILNIKGNNIDDEGAEEIAKVLDVNKTLRILNISSNQITGKGVQVLAKVLKVNTTLKSFNISFNKIGIDGATEIAEVLKVNQTLTTILITNNQFDDVGARVLVEALRVNNILTKLKIYGVGISHNDIMIRIETDRSEALQNNRKLFLGKYIKTCSVTPGQQSRDRESIGFIIDRLKEEFPEKDNSEFLKPTFINALETQKLCIEAQGEQNSINYASLIHSIDMFGVPYCDIINDNYYPWKDPMYLVVI